MRELLDELIRGLGVLTLLTIVIGLLTLCGYLLFHAVGAIL